MSLDPGILLAKRNQSSITKIGLSIVIVSWNTSRLLSECLSSIYAERPDFLFEVIVVDNASSDGTCDMLRKDFPHVYLIENKENAGFSRANNQGIRCASASRILLLNPDTVLSPGVLNTLVSFMDAHPGAGAAGARLVDVDGSLQPSCHRHPTILREFWRLFRLDLLRSHSRYDMTSWRLDTPRLVDVVQGACVILRRGALEQVGLLDEDYFIYSEEVDFCRKLRRIGWEVWWVPQAQVVHYGGQSTQRVASEMFLRLHQAKILYFRKQHSRPTALVYKIVLLAAAVARILLSPLALLEEPAERISHLKLTARYWRLLLALRRM